MPAAPESPALGPTAAAPSASASSSSSSTPPPCTPATTGTTEAPLPLAKLEGYDLYHSLGSPKHVLAPMVDASELAWRVLSRAPVPLARGQPPAVGLSYTPMINAGMLAKAGADSAKRARGYFDLIEDEEGSQEELGQWGVSDRPLVVQFCANDPETLLTAAKRIQHRCDAVDINLGCPQGIAKRGNYGAFLMEDWDLIHNLISILHKNLSVPVTAKFRVFDTTEKTVAYAQMLERAGAQILTCHGRTREMKGHHTGLADWDKIKAVKKAVKVPVFANGNILYYEDVERCMAYTGCDGVMSAEGNLYNPAVFLPDSYPLATSLSRRYLEIVSSLKTETSGSAIKGHLFKLLRPTLERPEFHDLRSAMSGSVGAASEWLVLVGRVEDRMRELGVPVDEVERDGGKLVGIKTREDGLRDIPWFRAQPHTRPLDPAAGPEGVKEMSTSTDEATAAADGVGPQKQTAPKCNPPGSKGCSNISSANCTTRSCLTHCRIEGARKAGLIPPTEKAEREAEKQEWVGHGCEMHEGKVRARLEAKAAKKAAGKRKREERERAGSPVDPRAATAGVKKKGGQLKTSTVTVVVDDAAVGGDEEELMNEMP